jgi:integrase
MTDEKALVAVVVEPSALAQSSALVPSGNPATVFLSRFTTEQSRRTMHASLRLLGSLILGRPVADPREVPWEQTRYAHAQRLRAMLIEQKYEPATINKHLVALRGVVMECARLGLLSRELATELEDVKGIPYVPKEKGRALPAAEVTLLFAACGDTIVGKRDAAILALAVGGGFRRSDVCDLDVENWDSTAGKLKVRGKHNTWRSVYLKKANRAAVESWLLVRGTAPGPFVSPVSKHGTVIAGKRLTTNGVYDVLAAICTRAKITNFTPHDLRRTYISRLLSKGVDLSTVAQLVGHKSVQTTMRYDKRDDTAKEAAADIDD